MAFPTSPSSGDTYTYNGVVYTWNGYSWRYSEPNLDGRASNIKSFTPPILAPVTSKTQAGEGGYEFTGAFADRMIGDGTVQYTSAQAVGNTWRRFGLTSAANAALDNEYWGESSPKYDKNRGLFGGLHMPSAVAEMYAWDDTALSAAVTTGDLQYTEAVGSLDFTQCRVGDLLRVRFDFNVTPQQANTTLEVCLIWATRNENDEVTFTFPLTAQPIFFGTGTVGRTMLNRVELSAYFASDEDINARALPAIKADNEILIAPLTMLTSITR